MKRFSCLLHKIRCGNSYAYLQHMELWINDKHHLIHSSPNSKHLIFLVRTEGGVHYHDDKLEVTVPSAMFIKALDVMLERMVDRGFQFEKVVALSGDAQVIHALFSQMFVDFLSIKAY